MKEDPQTSAKDQKREPNVLPPTEVVANPNPRANENLQDKSGETTMDNNDPALTGSEITDGEDA